MKQLIYSQPICTSYVCCNHDPNYPAHCSIMTDVQRCGMATVVCPNRFQRAIAWIDKYWLNIALILALLITFMIMGLASYSAITNTVIEDMRQQDDQYFKTIDAKTRTAAWRKLHRKHGYPTVIYERNKPPYYVNKSGRRCDFV